MLHFASNVICAIVFPGSSQVGVVDGDGSFDFSHVVFGQVRFVCADQHVLLLPSVWRQAGLPVRSDVRQRAHFAGIRIDSYSRRLVAGSYSFESIERSPFTAQHYENDAVDPVANASRVLTVALARAVFANLVEHELVANHKAGSNGFRGRPPSDDASGRHVGAIGEIEKLGVCGACLQFPSLAARLTSLSGGCPEIYKRRSRCVMTTRAFAVCGKRRHPRPFAHVCPRSVQQWPSEVFDTCGRLSTSSSTKTAELEELNCLELAPQSGAIGDPMHHTHGASHRA
jgi:hypothetical protein